MSHARYHGPLQAPRKLRVLIVEDSAIQQAIISLQLKRLGVDFDVVSNGIEAFLATGTCAYSLVIMDCHMPEMDGIEATTRIRHRDRASKYHVPIVGYSVDAIGQDCLDAGMDEFLQKPCGNAALGSLIERYMPLTAAVTLQLPPAAGA